MADFQKAIEKLTAGRPERPEFPPRPPEPAWNPSMPSRGRGDTVAKVTHATGIAQVVHGVAKALGKDCGCAGRQKRWNKRWPYSDKIESLPYVVPCVSECEWITSERLIADTKRFCGTLPVIPDVIVGVARSGLMPASFMATNYHVPLYSTSCAPEFPPTPVVHVGNGWRLSLAGPHPVKTVLIVDDTARRGNSARRLVPHVKAHWPDATVYMAAIYVHYEAVKWIDYPAALYGGYHFLEWNLFNTGLMSKTITDLDGVLFPDVPAAVDDDGEKYRDWIANVRPIQHPHLTPIAAIVTARLERWRAETEKSLKRHGIAYKQLIMGPWKTPQERVEEPNRVADWKAGYYTGRFQLFVESDPRQARRIAERGPGRKVLCPRLRRLLNCKE